MNRAEFNRLKGVILSHLKTKTRMDRIQIATALGLTSTVDDGERRVRPVVNDLLESLKDDGEIRVIEPSVARSTTYYVLSNYRPETLKNSGSPENASYRSYIDPSLKGTWQPPAKAVQGEPEPDEPKRSTFQIRVKPMTEPNAIDKHLQQFKDKMTPQRKAEISKEKMTAALTDLIAEGKPFGMAEFCKRAGVSETLIYDPKFKDIKERAKQAIADIKGKGKSATAPVKVAEMKAAEPGRAAELERQIAELEQRNRELRHQLAAAQTQTQPAESNYLQALRADEQDWRATLQRIDAELVELEQDRKAAIANLYAVQRLIATKTGEEPALEMQLVVPANGNGNGNGHKVCQA